MLLVWQLNCLLIAVPLYNTKMEVTILFYSLLKVFPVGQSVTRTISHRMLSFTLGKESLIDKVHHHASDDIWMCGVERGSKERHGVAKRTCGEVNGVCYLVLPFLLLHSLY